MLHQTAIGIETEQKLYEQLYKVLNELPIYLYFMLLSNMTLWQQ